MGRAVKHEACPRCRERGQDRRGDNLGVYADGGLHCYSCGYHRNGKFQLTPINTEHDKKETSALPREFTRTIPAECWRWLLAFGLPYSYWQAYCGYSAAENRLIFTWGEPIRFSQGRAFTVGDSKWKNYGNRYDHCEVLSPELAGPIVLVEDIISAHKVAQVSPAIPLFGTTVSDIAVRTLLKAKRPVVLWLDADQYQLLPKKINRLQSLLGTQVSYVQTENDPKEHSVQEIKGLLHV